MYKVGDEVLIKGEVIEVMNDVPYPVRVRLGSDNGGLVFTNDEICYADKIVKTYEMGLNDAWELAKKVSMLNPEDKYNIFRIEDAMVCDILSDNTYEEALAKIETYEKEKEIKVGDEVVHGEGSFQTKFTVTFFESNKVEGFDKNGNTHSFCYPNPYIKKTGKHIDIESLLKQIGE